LQLKQPIPDPRDPAKRRSPLYALLEPVFCTTEVNIAEVQGAVREIPFSFVLDFDLGDKLGVIPSIPLEDASYRAMIAKVNQLVPTLPADKVHDTFSPFAYPETPSSRATISSSW
jgi:hypothetical protein